MMRWRTRCAAWSPAGLLPERAGQPVKVWAHVSLAELRALDDGSVLAQEWVGEMAVRWAARRAAASQAGSDGAAWLDGKPARAVACDASVIPVVTGGIDPGALDDLVGLCLTLRRPRPALRRRGPEPGGPARPARRPTRLARRGTPKTWTRLRGQASPVTRGQAARPAPDRPMTRPARQPMTRPRPARRRPLPVRRPAPPGPRRRRRRGRRCSGTRSSAGPSTWSPARAGSPSFLRTRLLGARLAGP